MNKIYRIVFNTVTGRWVVASELATGRKKQGGGERLAVAAVIVTGALGSLMGAAHAGVVVNGNPQEASASCELITDSGTTTWTASTSAGACLAPVLAGSASGQGNPGADAVFYASNATNGAEDSLNLGGYLDTWKTATFHAGIAMDGQKITGLANGTAATDAATFGQLTSATKYFHVNSTLADANTYAVGDIAIGGDAVASRPGFNAQGNSIAIGTGATGNGMNSIAIGKGAATNTGSLYSGTDSAMAIGTSAYAEGWNATAIGNGAKAGVAGSISNSLALGTNATALVAGSVALGANSVADRANTVSVGNAGAERQVVNMAKGTADTDAVNVSQLKGVTTGLGGGAAVNADGSIKAPSYALTNANAIGGTTGAAADVGAGFAKVDGALGKLGTQVAQNTSDIAGNTTSISNLQNTVNNISGGTAGLVQQSAAGANLTVGKATDGVAVDFAGTGGARKLLNVADGTIAANSKEGVNAGQLYTTNQNVATLDGRVTTAEGNITNLQTTVNNINAGTVGLVQQSAAGANLTVGKATDGAAVDFADKNAAARKLVSVADGTVAANSKDAVNGGQLYTTNQNVAQNTTDIGALGGRVTTAEGNITNLDGRVTQNTTDISTINSTIAGMGSVMADAVVYDSASHDKVTLGTAGTPVQLTNVKAAALSGTSTDAVNGSQLYATNQVVAQNTADISSLDGRVTTNEGTISSLDTRVTTNEGDISTLKTDVTNIDGRVTTTEGNITSLDNRVTRNEGDISTLNTNVSNIDGRVTNVEGSVTNITNQLNSGEIGLVQYDDAAGVVSVAKDKAGTAVDFRGTAGARRLKGVAAGGEDEDAVNVSQLKKITDAMGGGASVNADGSITAPTYYVTNADGSKSSVTNMGDAMSNIDSRVYNNTTSISTINQQISSGTIGMVQQASAGAKLTVGKDTDGTEVDFADKDGNARKLTNVADGAVAAGSKDAVNGGQLHAVSQSMASALGGGSTVNADGTISAPTYTVTNADGSTSQVTGVEGAISNIDNRTYQNTTAITNNTSAINNLTTQISNGEVGLVKQDAATRQITVAKDSDGDSVNMAGTAGDRVVTGVASAKADNDAVNLGQLKAAGVVDANGASKSVVSYDDAGKTSITMGGEGATTAVTVHNVADGVADHDAVNVSQLNTRLQQNTTEVLVQTNSYTDQKLGDVWTGMDKLSNEVAKQDGRISQHGAMSMAEAQMASGAAAAAVGNPNGAWSVGLGSEQGHGAISAGYAKPIGAKSQISFGAAFSGDDHSVGVGFAHKL